MNLNELAQQIYQANKEKGFWDEKRNVGEMLMLITSELGEAMEAHRKGRSADAYWLDKLYFVDDKDELDIVIKLFQINVKDTFEDEIADTLIRLLDMCAGLDIDIQKHVELKLNYNKTRPYKHGKKY